MCEMSWKEPFWNVFVYQHFPFDLLLGFHRGDSGQTLVLSMAFATITNNCNFCCDFVLQPYKFFWLKNSKSNKNLIIFSGFLCIHFQILNADSAFEVEVPDGWTDGRRTYSKTMPLKWYINFPESGCTYIHTAPASSQPLQRNNGTSFLICSGFVLFVENATDSSEDWSELKIYVPLIYNSCNRNSPIHWLDSGNNSSSSNIHSPFQSMRE